jgi:hypothetical protein
MAEEMKNEEVRMKNEEWKSEIGNQGTPTTLLITRLQKLRIVDTARTQSLITVSIQGCPFFILISSFFISDVFADPLQIRLAPAVDRQGDTLRQFVRV